MRYQIGSPFAPLIELEIPEAPPPCMRCGDPVTRLSTDGPLICVPCCMGTRQDGTRLTYSEYEAGNAHARDYIARYRIDKEQCS